MTDEIKQTPEFHREVSLKYRPYFAFHYLGVKSPPHQKEWHKLLDKDSKRILLLAPRDHGKSTVVTYEFPLHEICKDRNIRILIISKTNRQAMKYIQMIINELENNKALVEDFGQFKSDTNWTANMIYVKRDKVMKDPTVEGIGVLGAITGGHFDLIVADDILDDENTKTQDRMETVKNWFLGTILQLCEPHTKVVVVGTRKHYLDLYNHLLESSGWDRKVYKAIIKYPDSYEYIRDGEDNIIDVKVEGKSEVLWQDRWDIKTLLKDRNDSGTILFDREKQNDPSGMRGSLLKKDWLNYYTEIPIEFRYVYQGVDLAISDSPDADFFVIATIGIDHHNNIYVLPFFRNRLGFPEQVTTVQQYFNMYRPIKVFVEKNAYQLALSQHLISTTDIPVVPVQTTKDKVTRMIALSPYFQNGRIKIKESFHDFITEYLHFPKGEHDDMLDALDLAMSDIKKGYQIEDDLVPVGIDIYKPSLKQKIYK